MKNSQSLGSVASSAQVVFKNTGDIKAGGNFKMNLIAIAGPAFERFRDKDIGEETSKLYSQYVEKYLPNSRDTEYDKISLWISRSEPIAWIHGGAGIGKSTFAHHLVLKLGESNHLATYGFFKRGMMNLNNIIDHMAYELGCRHQDIIPYLATVNPPSEDLSVRLSTLIIKPLSDLPGNEPKVIIFDALDECPRPQDLLKAIYKILQAIPSHVKFLITSRSGGEIESFIKQMKNSVYNLNISLAESSTMKSFFNHRLKGVRDFQKYRNDLIDRAGGLFIWADTVCTFVTSPNNGDPSELLKIVLSPQDSPYPTEKQLDDLYGAALNHLFPPMNQLARDNFKAIFTAIYVSLGPLNEQALEELVGRAPGGIVSSLRSLQTRPSNDDRVTPAADLFHASFLDFIVSKDRCDNGHFRIEPLEAHKKVATLCIELLSKTFNDDNPTQCAELSAAVRYAIGNWASHAAECISKLDNQDIPSAWKIFLEIHGNRWGGLLLSVIAGTAFTSSNPQGRGDDLLSWLNAEFLKFYRKKPLGGHLRKILHVNQVVEHFIREGKVWAQRQLTLLLGNLFKYSDIPANWTEAISLWPRENLGLASSFNSLASFFYFQFVSKGSINDLDEAISLSQAARSLQPAEYITLNNLALYLLLKFHETGHEKDLKDSVDLHQLVVKIPPPPFDCAWSLNNFASSLRSRFIQTGSKEDLEKAIKLHKGALHLLSFDPNRPISLGNLALCFETRFKNDGLLETLEEAISLHKEALMERDSSHSDYPGCLIALARSLQLRGRHVGSQEDLDKAISLSQEALEFHLARTNDSLSTAQVGDSPQLRFEGGIRGFEVSFLDYSPRAEDSPESHLEQGGIQNQYEVLTPMQTLPRSMQIRHTPDSHSIRDLQQPFWKKSQNKTKDIAPLPPATFMRWTGHHTDRVVCLTALASLLRTRFKRNGSLKDVDKAIVLHREALELRPAPHPDRASFLSSLVFSLSSRFEQNGSSKDVDESILLGREVLELQPTSHPDHQSSLINLAFYIQCRYEQVGSQDALLEAICLHREALKQCSATDPIRCYPLDNLANCLRFQFMQTKAITDLTLSISLHREALQIWPSHDPCRSSSLHGLAESLRCYSVQDNLEEIMSLHREALQVPATPRPIRFMVLCDLAECLRFRFGQKMSQEDMAEAILLYREALKLLPASHFRHRASLRKFCQLLQCRFDLNGTQEDLDEIRMIGQMLDEDVITKVDKDILVE